MTALATVLVSQILALSSCLASATILAAPQDSLLLELGKALGKAIRGEDAVEKMPPARAVLMEAVPINAVPSEKDQKELEARLQAYGVASAAWITITCQTTDEQQVKLNEIVSTIVNETTKEFANSRDPNRQHQRLPVTMPVLFTLPQAPGLGFTERLIKETKQSLLTEEQILQLEKSLDERDAVRKRAFQSYLVAVIDRELFLSTRQRETLLRQLEKRNTTLPHPLFAFNPQTAYMPYQSITTRIESIAGDELLEPSQQKRLRDLSTSNVGSQHLIIRSSAGQEMWDRQITEAAFQHRDLFLRAAAVRVTYYEQQLMLSEEQVNHLECATKGAAVRAVGEWKQQAQGTVDRMQAQMAQRAGDIGFGVANMEPNTIEQNEIWTVAVSSITEGAPREHLNERQELNRAASAKAMLALLDSELWLTPAQRGPLEKLILKSLPSGQVSNSYDQYARDLILLSYPLLKITEEDRSGILSEPQRNQWKQMESHFDWQKRNGYVQIHFQGGSFSYQLAD